MATLEQTLTQLKALGDEKRRAQNIKMDRMARSVTFVQVADWLNLNTFL
jgi:hypothetical protein